MRWLFTAAILLLIYGCSKDDSSEVFSCENLTIRLSELEYASCGGSNGNLTVTASGGKEPYEYRINDGDFQLSNVFTDLDPQYYNIYVMDQNDCIDSVRTFIGGVQEVRAIALVTPSGCGESNGSLEIIAKNGIEPYRYQLGEIDNYTFDNTFTDLPSGIYSVWVKDSRDCFLGIYPVVLTGIVSEDIMPFFQTSCNEGCHASDTKPDLTSKEVIEKKYNSILSIAKSSDHYHNPMPTSELDLLICWANDLELKKN